MEPLTVLGGAMLIIWELITVPLLEIKPKSSWMFISSFISLMLLISLTFVTNYSKVAGLVKEVLAQEAS